MDTSLANSVFPHWTLLATLPRQAAESLTLAACLAEKAPLLLLDGGNHANIYTIAQQAGWQENVLGRILVSRAFTCYQMAALLESVQPGSDTILVLDLISTFYDENVPFADRKRLLISCLRRIRGLSRGRRVIVTSCPPSSKSKDSGPLYELLLTVAPEVHIAEMPVLVEKQARLF